jgi:hypothetical protein
MPGFRSRAGAAVVMLEIMVVPLVVRGAARSALSVALFQATIAQCKKYSGLCEPVSPVSRQMRVSACL